MVAAPSGDLYTPFPRGPVIEEGFQSSEEGSDLHSPIFEVPYPPTQDVRYHLGHLAAPDVNNVTTSLVHPQFDARYPIHDLNTVQIPDTHLLETLQLPNATAIHHGLPQPLSQSDYGLQHQSILDLDPHPGRLQLAALSPTDEFTFNLPQSRLSEPQLSVPHEPRPSSSSRDTFSMSSAEQKPQIMPSTNAVKGSTSASGGNAAPTRTPRREASTAVIACRQCRARKIRCDSTRPVCNNCTRRQNECEYDAAPKRRGPDKRPGTRQRSCKKRPPESEVSGPITKKRRKTNGDHDGSLISFDVKENATGNTKRSIPTSRFMPDGTSGVQIPQTEPLVLETSISHRQLASEAIYPKQDEFSAISRRCLSYGYSPMDSPLNKSFARPIDVNVHQQQDDDQERKDVIPLSPSTEYSRRSWWDHLLDTYASTREQSMREIFSDLEFLLTTSSYWLFFFNAPVFFQNLSNPQSRAHVQPSLILAALALATLTRSSEIELGHAGRERALCLREYAQQTLEAACASDATMDYTLAEAALILALFDSSCHPTHTPEQATASLQFLDRLIQTLSLSLTDIAEPDLPPFSPGTVPAVFVSQRSTRKCLCISPSSPPVTPTDSTHFSFSFSFNPPWDPNWTPEEMRKEECRRICWSALTLISSYTSQCAAFHLEPINLFLAEPANYALLFPGEAYERSAQHQIPGQHPKNSIWALYCRSMLLWNSCISQRDSSWTTEDRATFAIDAWVETREIQDALDTHQCNLDTALMYLCREYIYNTRMTITYELRRSLQDVDIGVPQFNRRQAEEWLYYQDQVARRVKDSVIQLGEAPGHLLSRRPYQVNWFSSQVAICLALWHHDHNLMHALDLAKAFMTPLDALNTLWPCPSARHRRDELFRQLEEACAAAHVPAPLPPSVTLPPMLQH